MSDESVDPRIIDALIAGLSGMARAVHSYYMALVEQGFPPEDAMVLTVAWQETVLQLGTGQ